VTEKLVCQFRMHHQMVQRGLGAISRHCRPDCLGIIADYEKTVNQDFPPLLSSVLSFLFSLVVLILKTDPLPSSHP